MLRPVGKLLEQLGIGLSAYRGTERVYTNNCAINTEAIPEWDRVAVLDGVPFLFSKLEDEGVTYAISIDLTKLVAVTDLIDGPGGLFIRADPAGVPINNDIHEEDAKGFEEAVARAVRDKEMVLGPKARFKVGPEWKWFDVAIQGKDTPFSPDVIGVGRDLTALIDRSKKVGQLQGLLNSIFNNSPAQIYAIDRQGSVYLWEGKDLFLDRGVLGLDYREAFSEWPELVASVERAMKGEEVEWALTYKGRHLESRLNPSLAESGVVGAIGVISDRTEVTIKAEELKQFAYIASHDLKEPLRMIVGYVQLLLKHCHGALDDKGNRYAKTIVDGCERMRQLIDDLLSYSKVGAHKEPTRVSLLSSVRRVLAGLGPQIEEAKAKVSYPEETLYVWADEIQVDQLLQNLISNAIKFSDDPKVAVRWQLVGQCVEVSVEDNGIGIDEGYKEYIFQPFKRLDRRYPGSGVGLSICKKVVEINGGSIRLESKQGVGTTFYVLLPIGGKKCAT